MQESRISTQSHRQRVREGSKRVICLKCGFLLSFSKPWFECWMNLHDCSETELQLFLKLCKWTAPLTELSGKWSNFQHMWLSCNEPVSHNQDFLNITAPCAPSMAAILITECHSEGLLYSGAYTHTKGVGDKSPTWYLFTLLLTSRNEKNVYNLSASGAFSWVSGEHNAHLLTDQPRTQLKFNC